MFRHGWSKGKMAEYEVVEVEPKEEKRILHLPRSNWPSFYHIVRLIFNPQSVVHVLYWPNILHEAVNTVATAYASFSSSVSRGRFEDFYQILYCLLAKTVSTAKLFVSELVDWDQFLAVGTFFSRICANGKSAILFFFTNFAPRLVS